MKGTGDEEEKKRQNIFIHFLETKIPGGREREKTKQKKKKKFFSYSTVTVEKCMLSCVCVLQKSFEKGLPTDAA